MRYPNIYVSFFFVSLVSYISAFVVPEIYDKDKLAAFRAI